MTEYSSSLVGRNSFLDRTVAGEQNLLLVQFGPLVSFSCFFSSSLSAKVWDVTFKRGQQFAMIFAKSAEHRFLDDSQGHRVLPTNKRGFVLNYAIFAGTA